MSAAELLLPRREPEPQPRPSLNQGLYLNQGSGLQPRPSLATYAAFTAVGLGQGWLSSDALFQQLPRFQRTQPEGAALGAYMGGATNAGSMCALCLVALATIFHARTSQCVEDITVVVMICATVACLAFASLGWDWNIGEHSVAILALSFCSGAIGALRMAIAMPWHLRYDPCLISANLLGGTIAGALIATLAALQQPGGDCIFEPGLFFALCTLLTLPSALALFAIRKYDLGSLPLRVLVSGSLHDFHGLDRPAVSALSSTTRLDHLAPLAISALPSVVGVVNSAKGARVLPPWAPRAIALGIMYACTQSLVWGVTPGVLPYASAHVSAGAHPFGLSSHSLLALAMQASFFGLFVGSSLALLVDLRLPVFAGFALIGLNSLIPFVLALDVHGLMRGPAAAATLVLSCTLARGLEGFVVPSIFRAISSDESYGEAKPRVQRALVICERLATMAGSVCTLALVTLFLDRQGIVPSADDQ